MVLAQVTTIAVFVVDHFEKVLQVHHLSCLFLCAVASPRFLAAASRSCLEGRFLGTGPLDSSSDDDEDEKSDTEGDVSSAPALRAISVTIFHRSRAGDIGDLGVVTGAERSSWWWSADDDASGVCVRGGCGVVTSLYFASLTACANLVSTSCICLHGQDQPRTT